MITTTVYVIACIISVVAGAAIGFFVGWLLFQMGLEIIGSSIALAGAGVGGILLLSGFIAWSDRILTRMES